MIYHLKLYKAKHILQDAEGQGDSRSKSKDTEVMKLCSQLLRKLCQTAFFMVSQGYLQ